MTMLDVLAVCLFLVATGAVALWGWYRDSRGAVIFTPFLLFSLSEATRNWPAGLYAPLTGASPSFHALYAMLAAYGAFVVGFVLCAGPARVGAALPLGFRAADLDRRSDAAYLVVLACGAVVLTAAGLYLYRGLPPVALGMRGLLLGAGVEDVAVLVNFGRRALTKGHLFGGEYRGQGILRLVMQVGWPYLLAMSVLLYVRSRRAVWLGVSGFMLLATYLFVAGDGTRGPFLWSVISIVVVVAMVQPVKHRVLVYAALAVIVLAAAISITGRFRRLIGTDEFVTALIGRVLERILLGNGINSVQIIDLVREHTWQLRLGSNHLLELANALPGVSAGGLPVAYELYLAQNPGGTASTFSTPTYLALAYLDFGFVGAMMVYFVAGVALATSYRAIFLAPKTILWIPALAAVCLALGRLPGIGLVGVLTTIGMTLAYAAVLGFVLWICDLVAGRRRGAMVEAS